MLQDHLALWVEDEADVEEAAVPFRMAGFGLSHHVHAVFARDFAERLGLRTRDVDGAGIGELDMVEVHHFVVEAL